MGSKESTPVETSSIYVPNYAQNPATSTIPPAESTIGTNPSSIDPILVNNNNLNNNVAQSQINMASSTPNLTTNLNNDKPLYQSSLPIGLQNNSIQLYPIYKIYVICRLPGREIKVKNLSDVNKIIDIEPFIAPDKFDEFEIYDTYGNLINRYIHKKFKEVFNTRYIIYLTFRRVCLFYLEDIRRFIARSTFLYGNINFDKPGHFSIFVFNKQNNSTIQVEYSTQFYQIMQRVNQFSAYCNALNKLYISGGELSNGVVTDAFISIDLSTVQTNSFFPRILCNLKKRRYWHSMIFIPDRFIFIVGGPNTREVELYDMKRNWTGIDSYLLTERCEPSLIVVNQKFLYAFCGFHLYETFIQSIERCDLHRRRRMWEMVNYRLENCPGLITSFYGVTYIENDILLVSDRESPNDFKPNYVLSPGLDGDDVIRLEGVMDSRSSRLFTEKFFIPYNDVESLSLPFKSGEPKLFMVNNLTGKINELCLKETL